MLNSVTAPYIFEVNLEQAWLTLTLSYIIDYNILADYILRLFYHRWEFYEQRRISIICARRFSCEREALKDLFRRYGDHKVCEDYGRRTEALKARGDNSGELIKR